MATKEILKEMLKKYKMKHIASQDIEGVQFFTKFCTACSEFSLNMFKITKK